MIKHNFKIIKNLNYIKTKISFSSKLLVCKCMCLFFLNTFLVSKIASIFSCQTLNDANLFTDIKSMLVVIYFLKKMFTSNNISKKL